MDLVGRDRAGSRRRAGGRGAPGHARAADATGRCTGRGAGGRQGEAADVAWWADGWLHLEHAALEVGGVQRLVAVGTGAAYVDDDGRLVHVDERGRRTLLGQPDAKVAVVSSPRLGLVAWVDVARPDVRRIVVWDVAERRQVAGVVTSPRSRTISFDGGWLTFGQGLTDWAWDPAGGPARETGNGFAERCNRSHRTRRRGGRYPARAAGQLPARGQGGGA